MADSKKTSPTKKSAKPTKASLLSSWLNRLRDISVRTKKMGNAAELKQQHWRVLGLMLILICVVVVGVLMTHQKKDIKPTLPSQPPASTENFTKPLEQIDPQTLWREQSEDLLNTDHKAVVRLTQQQATLARLNALHLHALQRNLDQVTHQLQALQIRQQKPWNVSRKALSKKKLGSTQRWQMHSIDLLPNHPHCKPSQSETILKKNGPEFCAGREFCEGGRVARSRCRCRRDVTGRP